MTGYLLNRPISSSIYTKNKSSVCMHLGCRMTCYRTAIYSWRKTAKRSLLAMGEYGSRQTKLPRVRCRARMQCTDFRPDVRLTCRTNVCFSFFLPHRLASTPNPTTTSFLKIPANKYPPFQSAHLFLSSLSPFLPLTLRQQISHKFLHHFNTLGAALTRASTCSGHRPRRSCLLAGMVYVFKGPHRAHRRLRPPYGGIAVHTPAIATHSLFHLTPLLFTGQRPHLTALLGDSRCQ